VCDRLDQFFDHFLAGGEFLISALDLNRLFALELHLHLAFF
jgi:hypothetical protein